MPRKIFKYQLSLQVATNDLTMPTGAEVRYVGHQRGEVCLWADVETLAPPSKRSFIVADTGQNIPKDAEYAGTVQFPPYVWHVFEVHQ